MSDSLKNNQRINQLLSWLKEKLPREQEEFDLQNNIFVDYSISWYPKMIVFDPDSQIYAFVQNEKFLDEVDELGIFKASQDLEVCIKEYFRQSNLEYEEFVINHPVIQIN